MRILITVVLTLVVVVILGGALVFSGIYDVAAVHPDNPILAGVIHMTSERSVAAHKGGIVVPAGYDAPDKAMAGAKEFGETCVTCHGGPGLDRSAIAAGLNPKAPPLHNQKRDPDPQEDYWFVSNGVKMTAMPGFAKSMKEDDMWNVVAFLKTLPGMSAEEFTKETGVSPQNAPGGKIAVTLKADTADGNNSSAAPPSSSD